MKAGEEERAKQSASYAVVVDTKTGPRDVPLREEPELAQHMASKTVVLRVWPGGRTDLL